MAKCPDCGKQMKSGSIKRHLETVHGKAAKKESVPEIQHDWQKGEEVVLAAEALSRPPQLGGENGRLRTLARFDQKWEDVIHAYNKVSGKADTPEERKKLRVALQAQRALERW